MARKASQPHPRWPKVKGQATDIITLHFNGLQKLTFYCKVEKTGEKTIFACFWPYFGAQKWSQTHPNRHIMKGQATNIIKLPSHALQNLPLTAE